MPCYCLQYTLWRMSVLKNVYVRNLFCLRFFLTKIIMPVERIEIFTNFVSANDEKHQPK